MNSTPYRRTVAIVGAAAITSITAFTFGPATASAAAGQPDRPCFMVRAHWNTAEGPQPTCPVPTWQRTAGAASSTTGTGSDEATVAGDTTGAPRPAPSARIGGDFMP